MSIGLRSDVTPSDNDLPQETKPSKVTDLELRLQAWHRRARQALHDDNKNALRDLFVELSDLVPQESVSHEWLRVVSGWDAKATTG
jgi:hypothetical protein